MIAPTKAEIGALIAAGVELITSPDEGPAVKSATATPAGAVAIELEAERDGKTYRIGVFIPADAITIFSMGDWSEIPGVDR